MSPPKGAADDDDSPSSASSTPKQKPNNVPVTPKNRKVSVGQTPKSAPAASRPAPPAVTPVNRPRRLSQSRKTQPSLLTDFLLGRPTQARIDAQRKKNADAAAVKADLRTAMRRSSVQRLQPPGGVRDRVKSWQKSNAAAMVRGNPEASPSEPTDHASFENDMSVTEQDRLRIRARQRQSSATRHATKSPKYPKTDGEDNGYTARQLLKGKMPQNRSDEGLHRFDKSDDDNASSDNYEGPKYHTMKVPKGRKGLDNYMTLGSPPKKRIVSDDNWMKRKGRSPPRPRSPKGKAATPAPMPIPKDFLQRTAQNPSVQIKIKDWAKRVEPPSPSKPADGTSRKYNTREDDRHSDESDATQKPKATSWRDAADDGIRIRPLRSTRSAEDGPPKQQRDASGKVRQKTRLFDDGIRVRPIAPGEPAEDRIEVILSDNETASPPRKGARNDGIRNSRRRTSAADEAANKTPPRSRSKSYPRFTYTVQSAPTASTRLDESSHDPAQSVTDQDDDIPYTPTKKPSLKRGAKDKRPLRKRDLSPTETRSEETATRTGSWHEGSQGSRSWSGDDDAASHEDSEFPSTIPPKSLADIPVGYSAFSELDLPVHGGTSRGRTKAARTQSFKGVPNVLKKVVSEGKKMIHDKVDPPRPMVANQPPSIENWLDETINPFVEGTTARKASSAQARQSTETQWKKDVRIRPSSETRKRSEAPSPTRGLREVRRARSHETSAANPISSVDDTETSDSPETPSNTAGQPANSRSSPKTTPTAQETPKQKVTPASGLKRSGATRSASSPLKSSGSKKPFRELLRDAFRGESGAYRPPISHPSYESGRDRSRERDGDLEDSQVDDLDSRDRLRRRSASGSSKDDTLTAITESAVDSVVTGTSDGSSSFASSATPSSYPLKRRPPPTSGDHELSTIVSVESYTVQAEDTLSTISESTVTEGSTITKLTEDISRQKSQRRSGSLKRRLTKHADLVSVLSLPEDAQLPARTKSIRLARSLHRKTSKLDNASLDDLLLEFAEDESIYRRELKTLVSGVIPVLLTQFVDHSGETRASELFGTGLPGQQLNVISRAVVDMGLALEKLSLLHQFVPITDAARMVKWLDKVYPIYDNYLDVWRLCFQGIIVNLAPAAGKSAEEDSMVNGMERNEDGDVLDENGERVDVAYLLKRPLMRIKWMLKFAKGVNIILGRGVAGDVADKLDTLNEKARRRNREETARNTDEDANATDTTRARDLRTLTLQDSISVDQTRQVSAKDWFDLSLSHSNGQRLECQVELVFRDKVSDPSDRGDVLVRETGSGGRTWLLFPPIPRARISARKGQDSRSLVIMIRDVHMGRDWYELITIVTEHEDTAADWLDILGTSPVPPSESRRMSLSPRSAEEVDVPVGERKLHIICDTEPREESPKARPTPSRYVKSRASPATPSGSSPLSDGDRTRTKRALASTDKEPSSHPLREDMRPDPAQLRKPAPSPSVREDGAPPPPAHRTPIKRPVPIVSPPADTSLPPPRIRRRTSSPLKHEYHPSDISSESDSTSQSSGSESSEPSSDELDEDDVPDTLPGISIKMADLGTAHSEISDNSLTPSNSASQAGLAGQRVPYSPEYSLQLMASISYWSNRKGVWKELGEPLSAIIITPGLIEAYMPGTNTTSTRSAFPNSSSVELEAGAPRPLIALDLTPLVMIRQSTVVDLEIRSPARSFSKYNSLDATIFRFRAQTPADLINLYTAVHRARMNNAKFKALEEEARFRSFGQPQNATDAGDDTSSRRRRSWFGRKNSYRASARAPSQSQGSSSSISATSFLKKLTGGAEVSFNINGSSVDRQSRAGSGGASFYTSSGSSSAGGGGFSAPRSPSVSLAESSNRGVQALGSTNIKMRCHLQTSANKWEDHGNCLLTIAKPPPGVRQELTIYHGLEKRVLVVSIPKKANEKPLVVVDVVVGSACFSRLAARGIVLNVWEEMRDEQNRVGAAPSTGAVSGRVRKWCFQFSSTMVASWVFGLVASEVQIA